MRRVITVGLAAIALLVGSGQVASAQSTPAGSGHWEGAISVQGKDLRLEIDLVARTADKWEGAAAFPDMNAKGLPLSAITVQGEAVTFIVKGVPGDPTFKGTLSKDAKTLAGDFTQGPVAGTFTLAWKGEAKLEAPPKNAAVGKDFEGTLGRHARRERHYAATDAEARRTRTAARRARSSASTRAPPRFRSA